MVFWLTGTANAQCRAEKLGDDRAVNDSPGPGHRVHQGEEGNDLERNLATEDFKLRLKSKEFPQ